MITYKHVAAATTNATVVRAGQTYLWGWQVVNTGAASVRAIKLYNKASAPTVGTDVPMITIRVSPSSAPSDPAVMLAHPISMVGLSFAFTVELTDAGASAVAANDCQLILFYE